MSNRRGTRNYDFNKSSHRKYIDNRKVSGEKIVTGKSYISNTADRWGREKKIEFEKKIYVEINLEKY